MILIVPANIEPLQKYLRIWREKTMPIERLCMVPECLKHAMKGFLYCRKHTLEFKKDLCLTTHDSPEAIYLTLKYEE